MRPYIPILSLPLAALASCTGNKIPEKLNIIYIMADDLGYGDLGVYGQEKIRTPNLDRMASEGLRFTQHYAGSTVCAPSRCCLMTGYHTGHAVVRGNSEVKPEGQRAMPEGTVTVAKLLQEAGYATGLFGKWGLGYPGSISDPNRAGFDEFYGYNCQRHAHRFYTEYLWHNGDRDSMPDNLNNQYVIYSQDRIIDHTLGFIRDHAGEPFFLYAAFTIPHAELLVPDEEIEPYREEFEEVPYIGTYYRSQPEPKAAYAGMVSRLDKDVDQILKLLEELNLDQKTVVFFTSDNGPHQEGGNDPEFFNSNGIYRGIKRDLYEGGIREPFIAWWPGVIEPGSVTDHLAAFWDFMPTACDLAGIEAPAGIDGISYLPTLIGKKQKQHEYLYWEFHEQGGKQAIRKGDWKAVRLRVSREDEPVTELYDLATDPSEEHNIADAHPDIVLEMDRLFVEVRTSDSLWPLLKVERER